VRVDDALPPGDGPGLGGGMSVEEIAVRLNLSPRRVEMILRDAVLKLLDAAIQDKTLRQAYEEVAQ